MNVKTKIKKIIGHNRLLFSLFLKQKNELKPRGATIDLNSIDFVGNTVNYADESNHIKVEHDCSIQRCRFIFDGSKNEVTIQNGCEINNTSFLIHGNGNHIEIGSREKIELSNFNATGNNNTLHIDGEGSLMMVAFMLQEDCNLIYIEKNTTMHGRQSKSVYITAQEGTTVHIDEDCMFSNDVVIRSSDAHALLDLNGSRINPPQNIYIGKHVWVGLRATIMKGTFVADHCMIGACAFVSGKYEEPNCLIAGVPARIIRRGIDWDRKYEKST